LTFERPELLPGLLLVPLAVWLGVRTLPRTRRSAIIVSLRAVAITCLTLALAGAGLESPRRDLAVVFLLDASDSVGAGRQAAEEWVRRAYEEAGSGARAGLVLFGRDALVERDVASVGGEAGRSVLSRPDASATDLGAAMRLALALFPEGSQKRIVLLSDGNDTTGSPEAVEGAARLAAAAGAQVHTRTLGVDRGGDALVEAISAPSRVREGQSFELEVVVRSAEARPATLEAMGDGRVLARRAVRLEPGENRFRIPVGPQPPGFRRWRARVVSPGDSVARNDEGNGFTYVEPPPRVLIVEGEAGEGRNLEDALKATGLDTRRIPVAGLPRGVTELGEYACVVLADVPLEELPDGGKLLQTYVRDLGNGLVAVGGEDSYALGGYFGSPLEAALPLDSRLKNRKEDPAVAVVMKIDKSGSMAEGGDSGGGGVSKVDLVKAAASRSAELLGPDDEYGVVAFDTAARWVLPLAPVGKAGDVEATISDVRAGGGTNIYAGLAAAVESLKGSRASVKHVILLTDGWSDAGDYRGLLAKARGANITVSTVSAAGGSPGLLAYLAREGGGQHYVARNGSDIPKILLRETRTKLRHYVQEREFVPDISAPSPVLKGLSAVPPLLGYVLTTPKPTAAVALSAGEERDPVLAQWQYGLGRSVAWTSDAKGRWARKWLGGPEYARLWSQAVGWAMARPSENLQVAVSRTGGEAVVEVDALRPDGSYLNGAEGKVSVVSPSNETTDRILTQTAPGRYEARLPASEEGSYLASVALAADGRTLSAPTTGFAVGYSQEYRATGPDRAAMARVAGLTGGRELGEPREAWGGDLPATRATWPLWWPLTLLALLLLPVEVAARRLKMRALPALPVAPRARTPRRKAPVGGAPFLVTPGETARTLAPAPEVEVAPAVVADPNDPLERLRGAKRRAGRR
jgi:Mg-chelatase subunit ChlD